MFQFSSKTLTNLKAFGSHNILYESYKTTVTMYNCTTLLCTILFWLVRRDLINYVHFSNPYSFGNRITNKTAVHLEEQKLIGSLSIFFQKNYILIRFWDTSPTDISPKNFSLTESSPKTFQRRTLSRKTVPQTGNSPNGHSAEGHFPERTFPRITFFYLFKSLFTVGI